MRRVFCAAQASLERGKQLSSGGGVLAAAGRGDNTGDRRGAADFVQQPFLNYLRAATVLALGLIFGLAATALSLRSGAGLAAVRAGPWTAWPRIGGVDIDPYARAALARAGTAPLGRDQGLYFIARADSGGAPLDGRCEYRIGGATPSARYWTLTLSRPGGGLAPTANDRHGFSSSELLRKEGGAFEIAIAREARYGNWLSPGDLSSFSLTLRLYDSTLDVDARQDAANFPVITRLRCA